MTVPGIRADAERWWNGDADLVHDEHPVSANHRYGEEIADGILYYKSLASATIVPSLIAAIATVATPAP